jgi:hypothetical protein
MALREIETNKVTYIDAQNYEFFPPNLRLGVLPSSTARERFFSLLKYKNLGFRLGCNEILARGGVVKQLRGILLSAKVARFTFRVIRLSSREDIKNIELNNYNLGLAIDGLFVGISGSTLYQPSEIPFLQKIRAVTIFVSSYNKFNVILNKYKIERLYLVNGRDALGSGCIASCIKNEVEFFTLERGNLPTLKSLPTLGVWKGNMHKWRNKKMLLALKINGHNPEEAKKIATITFEKSYGFNSRWWNSKEKIVAVPGVNVPNQPFVTFFSTSEVEFSGIQDEAAVVETNEQITQFNLLKNVTKELGIKLVLRLHPNSGSKQYKFEELKWNELIKNDPNVFLISGSNPINSYQLGGLSLRNFVYRSSLAAEFIRKGLPVSLLAETFWTTSEVDLVCQNSDEIIDAIRNSKRKYEDQNWINFGFYFGCNGEEFRFYDFKKVNGNLREFFKDIAIDVPRWGRDGQSRG